MKLFGTDKIDSNAQFSVDSEKEDGKTVIKIFNDVTILFDENNEIKKILAFSKDPSIVTHDMTTEEVEEYCLQKLPDVESLFGIEAEYDVTEINDFDDDYLLLTIEKQLENGINNDF